jgi:hypothetical protein
VVRFEFEGRFPFGDGAALRLKSGTIYQSSRLSKLTAQSKIQLNQLLISCDSPNRLSCAESRPPWFDLALGLQSTHSPLLCHAGRRRSLEAAAPLPLIRARRGSASLDGDADTGIVDVPGLRPVVGALAGDLGHAAIEARSGRNRQAATDCGVTTEQAQGRALFGVAGQRRCRGQSSHGPHDGRAPAALALLEASSKQAHRPHGGKGRQRARDQDLLERICAEVHGRRSSRAYGAIR